MDVYIDVLETIGTIAFAISGSVEGIKHKLDAFGVLICGIVTATGGGIIRDLTIGITPPNAFTDPHYVVIATITSLVVFLFAMKYKSTFISYIKYSRVVNFADNIGLATFTIIAIQRCLPQYSDNLSVLLFVGVITATGGGVLRDLFTNTIPVIFRKRVYAVASLSGSLLFIFTYPLFGVTSSSLISLAFIVIIRLCASKYNWDIPKIQLD